MTRCPYPFWDPIPHLGTLPCVSESQLTLRPASTAPIASSAHPAFGLTKLTSSTFVILMLMFAHWL